jgi:redox-sensitive bicupin YhaK (pirin superfamily)
MKPSIRNVTQVVTAHRQREGAGFIVRRPIPTHDLALVDPFLLLDEFGPVVYAPGEALGAPDHPHRGFETVTYMLDGQFEHEDSAGHHGVLRAGDVQWMTAGGGIVHSEMPARHIQEKGGRIHGFQVWVNLPARLKMTRPRYQEIAGDQIPRGESADGRASVRVLAGEALGARAVIATHTPIVYQDWTLEPGADETLTLAADHHAMVYVFGGAVRIGDSDTAVGDGQLAVLGAGSAVRVRAVSGAEEAGRFLLLAGAPIGEPVARYGPFVMNTEAEIAAAIQDYRSGRMGEITRTAQIGTDGA